MKATSEQYAKLLHEAFKTSSENERKALIKGIATLIKQNGATAKMADIEARYQIIKKRESGKLEGVICSAWKLEEKELKEIQQAIAVKKDVSKKLINLKNEIDDNLKGGFIVKFENEIYDGSLDSRINRVKKALVG